MIELREYQEDYIKSVEESFREGKKAPCVVASCGAGKSIIITQIVKDTTSQGHFVLFLVHRIELCDQIREDFDKFDIDPQLYHIGMVQTVVRRLDRIPAPNLIITDEAHHGMAKTYRDIYNYFSEVPRIGFTATPIRMNEGGLGKVHDVLIEKVTVKWLIKNRYLSPYRYYSPKLIDDKTLKKSRTQDFSSESITEAMDENKYIYGDVVSHYKRLAKGEKAIVYCHSIESSQKTMRTFSRAGFTAAHLDGTTNKIEREATIDQFRSGTIQILCNVDLIGEGFNVPDCSVVILLRPTRSLSLYIQQSMRGMRYQPGKTSIIIDHVNNVERFGFPSQDRVWSLDEKKGGGSGDFPIKTCQNCYATVHSAVAICDTCGEEFPPQERDREKQVIDQELKEITPEEIKEITLDYRKPEDCTSYEELKELAKNRGYKVQWAYLQAKRLNLFGKKSDMKEGDKRMAFQFNFNDVYEGSGAIQDGEYEVIIKSVGENATQNGAEYIQFDLVIRNDVDQKYQNQYIFHKVWKSKTTNNYNMTMINTIAKNTQMDPTKQYKSLDELFRDFENKVARVYIKNETSEYQGKTYENVNVKSWSESRFKQHINHQFKERKQSNSTFNNQSGFQPEQFTISDDDLPF